MQRIVITRLPLDLRISPTVNFPSTTVIDSAVLFSKTKRGTSNFSRSHFHSQSYFRRSRKRRIETIRLAAPIDTVMRPQKNIGKAKCRRFPPPNAPPKTHMIPRSSGRRLPTPSKSDATIRTIMCQSSLEGGKRLAEEPDLYGLSSNVLLKRDNVNVHRAAANIIVSKSRAARGSVCNVLLCAVSHCPLPVGPNILKLCLVRRVWSRCDVNLSSC